MSVLVLFVLAASASAAPVWIVSKADTGMMISWEQRNSAGLELVVQSPTSRVTHKLDREKGTIIVPIPAPPYQVSYREKGGQLTRLASAGAAQPVSEPEAASKPPPEPQAVPGPAPTESTVRNVRVPFNVGPEQAILRMPSPPRHLQQQIRGSSKSIDLFIKVNPDGYVTGTSSPHYPDATRRELARLAADTAVKQWRFKPVRKVNDRYPYRDARIQLSFQRDGTSLRGYVN